MTCQFKNGDGLISLLGWTLMIHDDGWFIADRRSIIRAEGRAPNSGHLRPWWRSVAPRAQEDER